MKKRLLGLILLLCIVLNLFPNAAMAAFDMSSIDEIGDLEDMFKELNNMFDELSNLLDDFNINDGSTNDSKNESKKDSNNGSKSDNQNSNKNDSKSGSKSNSVKLTAEPSATSFVMDNKPVSVSQAYMVNGNNYLQLRAIADMLNGTAAQFNVLWDGKYAVIETGKPYNGKATPTALRTTTDVRKSNTAFKLNSTVITFDNAYLIDGDTNYLQLREFAEKLKGTASQFNVYWDAAAKKAVLVPGAAYTGEAPASIAPAEPTQENESSWKTVIADGWYSLRDAKNYVNITSKGLAVLNNDTALPLFYVKHIEGSKYTIQTADGNYLGVVGKPTNGIQVKLVNTKYLWTLRLEKGNDTFSLRSADDTKMLFNGAGQYTVEGTRICMWTYDKEDAPDYAEFKFIQADKSLTASMAIPPEQPKSAEPAKPSEPAEPAKPTEPAEPAKPAEPSRPNKIYTASDPNVTSQDFNTFLYDAEGKVIKYIEPGSEMVITKNITAIADYIFYTNTFSKFTVEENNPSFTVVDGVLFNKDKTKLIAYPGRKADQTYRIPDSVTEIASGAFAFSANLKEINFGSNLKVIGIDAFRGCHFTEVVIPDSVTTIMGCAFDDIKELKRITIPSSVTFVANDILLGSNPNVVVSGVYGSPAEAMAQNNGYKFEGTQPMGLTTIKLGQTANEAGLTGKYIGYCEDPKGLLVVYGSYDKLLIVFYENNKAKFMYTNDLSTYKGDGIVYTDKNDNRNYAASIGILPDLDPKTSEALIFYMTNAFRATHGLPALLWNEKLAASARLHSEDMERRNYFSHTNPEGLEPHDRIIAAGYNATASAENIYSDTSGVDPVQAMDAWVNSPPHRKCLLMTECNELGVGLSDKCATQNFGKQ